MLRVPYYRRPLTKDTENSTLLHPLIKKADIVMTWAVGRYNNNSYTNTAGIELAGDIQWVKTNKLDYVPLVFPGFSWGNLKNDEASYNSIPRGVDGVFIQRFFGNAKRRDQESATILKNAFATYFKNDGKVKPASNQ